MTSPPSKVAGGTGGAGARTWALVGLSLLLGRASASLLARSHGELFTEAPLGPGQWFACASIVGLFVWGEGWLALHRKWAPRVSARIRQIDGNTALHLRLMAPLTAVGLVGAAKGTIVRSWAGVAAIVLAVVAVRLLPQPWQGMVKLGVAMALTVGVASLVLRCVVLPWPTPAPPHRHPRTAGE